MLEINPDIMSTIAEKAKRDAGGEEHWVKAIDRALVMLDGNPYAEFRGGELLIVSDTSSEVYTANGSCQCRAYQFGRACKHRCAARLLQRYFEAVNYGALWIPKVIDADADGAVEMAVEFDGPFPARRRFHNNYGECWSEAA